MYQVPVRRMAAGAAAVLLALAPVLPLLSPAPASATPAVGLTWDADTGTPAAQDGSGTWNAANTNWYNPVTTSNTTWNSGTAITVQMTLTAAGCGMGQIIATDVKRRLEALPGVTEASVEVVWEPPWSPQRISPAGRTKLGLD